MMLHKFILLPLVLSLLYLDVHAQSKHWQDNPRTLHYTEDNGDFLLVNGRYRFNRALYGTHQASRVETGDLPEFALYMPGMAGNLQFVLRNGDRYKKLIDADHIETRYRPGSMRYHIKDALLGEGNLEIAVLAQADAEGMIVRIETQGLPQSSQFYAVYGGASGKRFSRNGDIGADPESGFYLLPEYCVGNVYKLSGNSFQLTYTGRREEKHTLIGSFSHVNQLRMADASSLSHLTQIAELGDQGAPIVTAAYGPQSEPIYIQVKGGQLGTSRYTANNLKETFDQAEKAREHLTSRIRLRTPDRHINTLGGALAVAADGIWESPTFLHGAVAWRMRLNAWRGAYAADVLGWHDRAKEHFSSYANSQVLEPPTGKVVMDTALNLARHIEEMGTSMFSSGYISRHPNNNTVPHHYDMNLVFFDQLFTHFDYTGDVDYLRKMWPTIVRHMDWEKRNFDVDGDGLYDAYCAIWASDGLQYSGGGVAHTTAYNYRANRAVAKLAKLIGEDPTPYEKEADKIYRALKERLWLADKGYFAEFQDLLGNRLLHDRPGLWTIYHIADAFLLDDFENYQNLQYVEHYIPKIPIKVEGQEYDGLYTLATTDWQPYTWSVNNVALAENLQASLAFWQAGRSQEAFQLWKSNLMESMYHGISPGNFQQLSHYDAFRGELYRDFADPVGVASRTLVEGLFGVRHRMLDREIHIRPGFPKEWAFAEIDMPEWSYKFRRDAQSTKLEFSARYADPVGLYLEIPVAYSRVLDVKVNGQSVRWELKPSAINQPIIVLSTGKGTKFVVEIETSGEPIAALLNDAERTYADVWDMKLPEGVVLQDSYDPQGLLASREDGQMTFHQAERKGTFFVQLRQGDMIWWQAVNLSLVAPVAHTFSKERDGYYLLLENRSATNKSVVLKRNVFQMSRTLPPGGRTKISIPSSYFSKGSNRFFLSVDDAEQEVMYTDWDVKRGYLYDPLPLGAYYNERVSLIFEQQYLSPRPPGPTLQLPTQGIGNWCYPLITADIDDTGLMQKRDKGLLTYQDIPFLIEGDDRNVLFTSQWDNFPETASIPLKGKAQKLYLMMAGSTNPMQSQIVNAQVTVNYEDGSSHVLDLVNPINWWPIEQDFLDDDYAFEIPDDLVPYRVSLKTGELFRGGQLEQYGEIKGFTTRAIEGGAATLLDLPLDPSKVLKSLEVKAVANDVVVGIMGATLLR